MVTCQYIDEIRQNILTYLAAVTNQLINLPKSSDRVS